MKRIIFGVTLLTAVACANAQASPPSRTFYKGSNFLRLTPSEQMGYLQGVIDGFDTAPDLYNDQDSPMRLAIYKCSKAMDLHGKQLYTIVSNYMQANPERWEYSMGELVLFAMAQSCKKVGIPIN
ncbi:hypothetical protein WS89_04440 [Burkholderia sp. MSMB1072]|uniref:Rap1a/Tai family immunity protein n=1 Tax=Burkholderia sp. MSMB1072 TaxID=1637871 RepID=UPI0007555B01|nr:Rap1a/Tai family immunity protein [Burkholderia sp. MSMB1072]KVH64537.1 hypothetical protein WS89_04440 [Burkholderia sp. MSMB1072]